MQGQPIGLVGSNYRDKRIIDAYIEGEGTENRPEFETSM
jgi:hypothetical protein